MTARPDPDPFPTVCPACGGPVGSLPVDHSGRPKLVVCFDCEPPQMFCEACQDDHREHP